MIGRHILVIKARAVSMLGGIEFMINGPFTKVGMMLMRFRPFCSANSNAAFSAKVLDTKYICKKSTSSYTVLRCSCIVTALPKSLGLKARSHYIQCSINSWLYLLILQQTKKVHGGGIVEDTNASINGFIKAPFSNKVCFP
ncbi:hypothetical protein DsansV1_C09g0089771 [Dioscorea sansibarensis]